MALPKIGLEAVLKNDAFNKAMSEYIKNIGKMGQETDIAAGNIGLQFLSLGPMVVKFAAITGAALVGLATAAAGALTAFSVDATKTAMSIESAFAGVIKTTDGLTSSIGVLNEVGYELKQGFKGLAEVVPVRVEDLMRIGELGGQLGIQRENLLEFTRTIADIGTATDLTTEAASMGFARLMNIMGTAQGDVGRLGSSIVDLGNNFATTEPEILQFALRIAGAGQIAGLTEADVLAIGTALSSVGVQAEAGGTAVQKVLLAMNSAVTLGAGSFVNNTKAIGENSAKLGELQQKLAIAQQQQAEFTDKTKESTRMAKAAQIDKLTAQIAGLTAETNLLNVAQGRLVEDSTLATFARISGLSVAEFRQMWEEDAAGAFNRFVGGLGEAGDEAIVFLEELDLTDQRLIRSFLSLAGAGDLLTRTIDASGTAWEENTALTYEAAQRYATTESQLKMLQNRWRNVKDDIGSQLLPALGQLVDIFSGFVEQHGPKLVALFSDYIVPAVEELVGAFADLVAGDVTGFLGGVEGALATLVGPEVATQIMEVVDAIQQFIQQAVAFITEHSEAFKAAFIAIGAVLTVLGIASAITMIGSAIAALANPVTLILLAVGALAAAWTEDWGGIRTTLTAFWNETAKPFIDTLVLWFTTTLPQALASVREWFITAWGNIQTALQTVWATLVGVWGSIVNVFTVTIPGALAAVRDWFVSVWETIQGTVQTVWATLVGVWDSLVSVFTVTIPTAAQALWQYLVDVMAAIGATFESVWDAILRFLADTWTAIRLTILITLESIAETISDVWDGIIAFLRKAWDTIRVVVLTAIILLLRLLGTNLDEVQATWEKAWNAVSTTVATIWKAIKSMVEEVAEAVRDFIITILLRIQDAWGTAWNAVSTAATTVWNAIQSTVETDFNAVKDFIETTLSTLKASWETAWNAISGAATANWNAIKGTTETVFTAVKDFVETTLSTLKTSWETAWNAISAAATAIWDAIKGTVEEVAEAIRSYMDEKVTAIKTQWETTWGLIRDKAGEIWDAIKAKVEEVIAALLLFLQGRAAAIMASIVDPIIAAKDAVANMVGQWVQVGKDLLDGLIQGFKDRVGRLIQSVRDAINSAVAEAKERLGIGSPSKIAALQIGVPFGEGISLGIEDAMLQLAQFDLPRMMAQLTAPAITRPATERVYAPAQMRAPIVRVNAGSPTYNNFDLTAQYRYQEERELMDDVRYLRLMAGA